MASNLQCISFLSLHYIQQQRSDHVKALAVADGLVPSCVRQQDALQDRAFRLVVLSTESTTPGAM